MKISKQFPTKFIKAVDLDGRDITLTIARVVVERLGQGNQAEDKPVAYFNKTNKGLVLNATIARSIAALYGDETDEWGGRRITVYPTRVKAFGETHDVVRVRPEIPAQPKPSQQAAVVEENVIDDMEDVTDEEDRDGAAPAGGDQRVIDPETGEIIDVAASLFEPESPSLQRLLDTGIMVLGDDWEMAQPWLVRQWTGKVTPKNKRDTISALSDAEQDLLADYLMEATVGLQSAWVKQKAAMIQATADPTTAHAKSEAA